MRKVPKKPNLNNLSELRKKVDRLRAYLEELGSVVIAFSGGVDSSFLLAMATDVLGKEEVLAVTALSPTYPSLERARAERFVKSQDIRHMTVLSHEMQDSAFISNPPERCYYCKKALMGQLLEIAEKEGLAYVAHGATKDDLSDFRPGLKAAQEMGAVAPLVEAELNKGEIRYLSKEMGLPTWSDPSMSCLAARIPYGQTITPHKLRMVEQAEEFLFREGFKQVRVRHHGTLARIELAPEHIEKIVEKNLRKRLIKVFREIGFNYVALDLEGYISGKMNRELHLSGK